MTTHPQELTHARDVHWQTVASSNVHSALYNETEGGDFYVRFLRSGPDDIYVYPNRARDEWDSFLQASSKGSWIWEHPIRSNWSYDMLTTRAFRDVQPEDVVPGVRDFLFKNL